MREEKGKEGKGRGEDTRERRRKEKGMTEDEMAGWHH